MLLAHAYARGRRQVTPDKLSRGIRVVRGIRGSDQARKADYSEQGKFARGAGKSEASGVGEKDGTIMRISISDKLVYVGIGAALGLLFAPRSGRETRGNLSGKIDELALKSKAKFRNRG